jgi:hypothetical protein
MLRHAEMPKGSRRVPNVYLTVHSRPRHTAEWVGLNNLALIIHLDLIPNRSAGALRNLLQRALALIKEFKHRRKRAKDF